jgi:ElaB/YqjD/DUF883 family membrane-anchored ribosome-binding protein
MQPMKDRLMNGNGNGRYPYQRNGDHARRMTEIALRGTALLWDLQADTARNLLEMQANGARLFGAPDFSRIFHMGTGSDKGMFSMTVDQALSQLRQIDDTVNEVQWQLAQAAERQTQGFAERLQQSIEELGRRSQEGLDEIRRIARQEAREFREAVGEHELRPGNGGRATHGVTAEGETAKRRPRARAASKKRARRRAA